MKSLKTGTTTVGVVCSDAVVLGAERKATMGYLVASKAAQKIMKLSDNIGMTIAGVVGDAQALQKYISAEIKLYELQEEKSINVKVVASLMSNILYARRGFPYIVQLIIGGYDTGPKLFSFDPTGSLMEEKEYFSSGSGSPTAFGVLEDNYRKGMNVEDAKKLVVRAIHAATKRDIASGGSGIDIVVIDSRGFRKIPDDEVNKLIK